MARSRRGRGEGGVERLPSGKWRGVKTAVVNGQRVRSSKSFDTKAEALEWLRTGGRPAKAGTVGEWLDAWLSLIKPDVAPKTYSHDAYRVKAYLKPKLGSVRLRDLTALAVSRMLAGMASEDDASDSERHKAGSVLRKALRSAVAHGQIPSSPMAGVKLPSPKHAEKRSLTREELAAFLKAADAAGCGSAYRLWADAGLRPGELLALTWGQVDESTCEVRVRWNLDAVTNELRELKTKKSRRTIKIAPSTARALAVARPLGTGPVVPDSRGGHFWQSNYLRWVFDPIRTAAGLEWVTPYTMRHTMATLLLQAGVNIKVVSERLGHTDIVTTLRTYCHVLPNMQTEAADTMEAILNGGANERNVEADP